MEIVLVVAQNYSCKNLLKVGPFPNTDWWQDSKHFSQGQWATLFRESVEGAEMAATARSQKESEVFR